MSLEIVIADVFGEMIDRIRWPGGDPGSLVGRLRGAR